MSTPSFEPIAIVGRACLLPGATSPEALWEAVVAGQDLTSHVPGERWRLSARNALGKPDASADRTWSDRGGYLRPEDFTFDPTGIDLPEAVLTDLDPVFQWALHTAREALGQVPNAARDRAGVILGNLSFPSQRFSQFAERTWLGDVRADAAGVEETNPHNRFMSGLPAHLVARGLGFGGPAFALDSACASSLYAIKLACDALQDRRADLMLAGAVNCADDLFIHVGFCALKALSATGQSRPFHADADGLVPGEGAAVVALERLSDARANGHAILGVIRGVGLSNDGRGAGLLVPSADGQARAMRSAWEQAGLSPSDVGLIECHATGTVVGDRTELNSMSEVFDGRDIPIGSLKSNLGHLITAAGAAGLLKVLSALEHGVRPPTRHAGPQNAALADSPFRLLTEAEPWTGPRRAGISAFGFGGNNAHLIVEAHDPDWAIPDWTTESTGQTANSEPVAIAAQYVVRDPETVELPLGQVKFPPADLRAALPQQTLMLQLALAAADDEQLPRDRTGVFIGMGTDPNVARYGARWRLADWLDAWGLPASELPAARDGVVDLLQSAGVVGTMPNIPANRLSSQLDLGGPSFVVNAEQLSGVRALEVACRALRTGELDAALVGAVDFAADPVHDRAAAALGLPPGENAAVLLVLRRASDVPSPVALVAPAPPKSGSETTLGGAHAAAGLLAVAEAAGGAQNGSEMCLTLRALGGACAVITVVGGPGSPRALARPERPFSLPASLDAPRFPEPAAPRPVDTEPLRVSEQQMPWPPAVPPILDWAADIVREPSPTPAIPESPTPPPVAPEIIAPVPPAQESPATMADTPRPDTLQNPLTQLFEAHQRFVEQQSRVHQHFLAMQSRLQQRSAAPQLTRQVPIPQITAPQIPAPQTPAPKAQAPVVAQTKPAQTAPLPKPKAVPASPKAAAPQTPAPKARPAAPAAPVSTLRKPSGPTFDRQQLEVHASGRISTIFGPLFEQQDGYERQVRMPEPPLLLADRVTGLDAKAGSMAKGTIWTETDVSWDSWYLHDGRMPAGIMIESGQADLMLISYLGIDFTNRSERVYRLLGCELTYHSASLPAGAPGTGHVLPKPGETLRYDIHVDGHARQGDIRLFFFHYDCRIGDDIRLSVREGQAGFFTEAELADSMGILWTPEEGERTDSPRLDAPKRLTERRQFDRKQLEAFADGDAYACFGPGFELAASHTRTPRISGGRMLFLDEVTHFDPKGGPWGRGYLRAMDTIEPDDWFFDGHFNADPCMPGTLMFEGCLQTMAFYLTAMGYTLDADGWRFEPVPDVAYKLLCRGEVDPSSRELLYEVFVDEIIDGPYPTLYADILCTVDGLKAFHCRRMGLRLVPGWPMDSRQQLLADHVETKPVAEADGFKFDYASLMACAWDRPSHAFGEMYRIFDDTRRVARLPGPPYHFMTRVTYVDGKVGEFKAGTTIEIEYDIPEDAWYFRENGAPTMPFAVLLEAALQPCGWLASFVGSATTVTENLFFRNLDGTGTLHTELLPTAGTLRTRTTITNISSSAGMIIESFDVHCFIDNVEVYTLKTVFGFFPAAALASQVGLAVSDEQRRFLEGPSERTVDLTRREGPAFDGSLQLPSPFLLMIDRVTGIWPDGGEAGLGRYRAEKDVVPHEWFFKAHFYQDPVQPGSLGIEAMIQLLQFAMIDRGMGADMTSPRFEPLMTGAEMSWKYRGQVRIHNKVIGSTIEITEIGEDDKGLFAIANGSLWVDGLRIYEARGLGMRIVDDVIDTSHLIETVNLETAPWLTDHRPTFTTPVIPMMGIVDRLAAAAAGEGRVVTGLSGVSIKRWCRVAPEVRLRHTIASDGRTARVTLFDADNGEEIARGTVHLRNHYVSGPAPLAALSGAGTEVIESPYADGSLFHGPAFQCLRSLTMGQSGASAVLTAGHPGCLDTILLDGATHAIPHDNLHRWCADIADDQVAYPAIVEAMTIHGPTPRSGEVRCEVRFDGFYGSDRFPRFSIQWIVGQSVWATMRLVEALFPKGPLGSAPPEDRRAFLRDGVAVEGVGLSTTTRGVTTLAVEHVAGSDWLPGTVASIYGSDDPETIARRDHLAHRIGVHPRVAERATPLNHFELTVEHTETPAPAITVRSAPEAPLDLTVVKSFWRQWFDRGPWPVEDLYYGLVQRFVRRVVLTDPEGLERIKGRGVIYLANHQTMIESLLMSIVASALAEAPTLTIAKDAHRDTWLGRLIAHCFSYPGVTDPGVIAFVDRSDPASLGKTVGGLADELAQGRSLLVHVEGTRALSPKPVETVSGAFLDLAMEMDLAIVPVRFVGGLPVEPAEERLEFPEGMGSQDLWLGAPILPQTLQTMPYGNRRRLVMEAINALGPRNEVPNAPDPDFAQRVAAHQKATGVDLAHAVLACVLAEAAESPEAEAVVAGKLGGLGVSTDVKTWLEGLRTRLWGESA